MKRFLQGVAGLLREKLRGLSQHGNKEAANLVQGLASSVSVKLRESWRASAVAFSKQESMLCKSHSLTSEERGQLLQCWMSGTFDNVGEKLSESPQFEMLLAERTAVEVAATAEQARQEALEKLLGCLQGQAVEAFMA